MATEAPATQTGGGEQTVSTPTPQAIPVVESTPTPSTLKPIPDKPRDDGGRFTKPDLSKHDLGFTPRADRDKSPDPRLPGRTAQKTPAPPATETTATEKAPGPAPTETVSPLRFSFAGQEFQDQAAAEHSFKTLQGMYGPTARALNEEKAKSQGWYQYAKQLEQQLQSAKPAGSPSAEATAAPEPSGEFDPLAGIDMGVFRLLAQNDGEGVAAAWLASEAIKNHQANIEKMIESKLQPYQEYQSNQQSQQKTQMALSNAYQWAADQKDQAGNPVFPEIGNKEAEHALGFFMAHLINQGVRPEVVFSPEGVHHAHLLYQDMARFQQSHEQSPSSPALNPAAAAVASALLQPQPGQEPVSGPSARTTQPGAPLSREDRVKQEILSAGAIDADLGFRKRSTPLPSL